MNAAFTEAIHELAADESGAMLCHLYSRINSPRYKMRVKWRQVMFVMWDDWMTQHYAGGDHYPSSRDLQGVTVNTPRYASLGLN